MIKLSRSRIPMPACGLFLLALWAALAGMSGPARAEPLGAGSEGQGMPEPLCEDGVVVDDGTNETGYGWVPSVIDGRYVQEFDSGQFSSRQLRSVCVCWLRTNLYDPDIEFEIVFYESFVDDKDLRQPVEEPYASVPVTATGVPQGVPGATFYEFSVLGTTLPEGISYVGVRWDASAYPFFFVCADQSRETTPVEVFFRDEQAEGWGRALDTSDPIFTDHKALLLRVVAEPAAAIDVPALGGWGLALLALLLAAAATRWVRRRSRTSGI